MTNGTRATLGIVPDRGFAVEFLAQPGGRNRACYLLAADRGTMPGARPPLAKSSFARKLPASAATWQQNLHRNRFGFHRFPVRTVPTRAARVKSRTAAATRLARAHGRFRFTLETAVEMNHETRETHENRGCE